jgi:hypothetical protein
MIRIQLEPAAEPRSRARSLVAIKVGSENSGQAFSAARFVISKDNGFESLREFAATIGTERAKIMSLVPSAPEYRTFGRVPPMSDGIEFIDMA